MKSLTINLDDDFYDQAIEATAFNCGWMASVEVAPGAVIDNPLTKEALVEQGMLKFFKDNIMMYKLNNARKAAEDSVKAIQDGVSDSVKAFSGAVTFSPIAEKAIIEGIK